MPKIKSAYTYEYKVLLSMLIKARKDAGLIQKDVAEAIGLSQPDMSKSELGERRIDPVELRGMCIRIGMGLEVFVQRWEAELRKRRRPRRKQGPTTER